MPSRIDIVLQQQVVVVVVYFGGRSKIPRLEPALKYECLVIWILPTVERLHVHFDELLLLRIIVFGVLGIGRLLGPFKKLLDVQQILLNYSVALLLLVHRLEINGHALIDKLTDLGHYVSIVENIVCGILVR